MSLRLNVTNREFQTILQEIKSNLTTDLPDVNDFLESNAGRYLLDQWAAMGDLIAFLVDRTAAEVYIDTVETRANLVSLLKLIGFQPQNPVPEQVMATLAMPTLQLSDSTIPRYTKLQAIKAGTAEVVPFVTANSGTIPVGELSTTAVAIQGEWKPLTFTSSGAAFQAFLINSRTVADGYIRAFVNSVEWDLAEDNTFVGHSATDAVFRIVNTSDQRVLVEFGSGAEGRIPPLGQAIRIEYLDTLHVNGRIKRNELRYVDNVIDGLTVSNAASSSGGRDFETIDLARARYPVAFKSLRRAVTLEDWAAQAGLVPGVLHSRAVDLNVDPTLPFFKVRLFVVGNGGLVSDALNKQVYDFLLTKRVNATVFEVTSPSVLLSNVKGSVFVYRSYNPDEVLSDVIAAVSGFFTMTGEEDSEIKIGQAVSYSRLIAKIQSVAGVAHLSLSEPEEDIKVENDEFVKLDTIDLRIGGLV